MKLCLNDTQKVDSWTKAGINLPGYDVVGTVKRTKEAPIWVHFGIGNIFRIFIGGISDAMLEKGVIDRGLTCVETFDYDVIDKIYKPFDNLSLSVILNNDGTEEKKVIGSLCESLKVIPDTPDYKRLMEIAKGKSLQIISFTITEKGYSLRSADGNILPFVEKDIKSGPNHCSTAMGIVSSMLYFRYLNGKLPIALVSMDNCSQNGKKLRESVLKMVNHWREEGYVDDGFVTYANNEETVAFPWTMIDKITPRPSKEIAKKLEIAGLEGMEPIITSKRTYIAPFVNAEKKQYLVIEDHFPNGRPPLEEAGVYMTDRDTVNKSERMKVTACLNPIHTALGPLGCVLGYDLFADVMEDPDLFALGRTVGYDESLPMVPNPGILSPKKFLDECMNERFPNRYLGDTCLRLATDASQGLGVRFGVTIQNYIKTYGSAKKLEGIPLAIAGWLRYLLAVDDQGNTFELAPDPIVPEMQKQLQGIVIGKQQSLHNQLKWILSNESIFFVNLYDAGIGDKIEAMFKELIAGYGSVRTTIHKYMGKKGE